ncbi:MAG TPA: hypothetical protein VNA22_04930 [Pyrinomonadaceae bacterium]|nr:hypothetical protein [Pyrinomonadaceae bacterium]
MKTVSGILMFVLLGGVAYAQQAPRAVTEIAVSNEKLVKGAPFSADAVSESVQTLADGNRIVRSSTSKLYRNSEGRFRREMSGGGGHGLTSLYNVGHGVTILDPVGGFRYTLDDNLKTARAITITPRSEIKVISGLDEKMKAELKAAGVASAKQLESGHLLADKIRAEVTAAVRAAPAIAATAVTGQIVTETLAPLAMPMAIGTKSKWETRTEELGTQNIEGVDAEGTRTVTTIPAGAIGNERAIEITYEKWFSKDLQLVVLSKHNDPRFGEQTYRLTNVNRSEPDPSLFTVPNSYRLVTEPSGTFTYTSAQRALEVEKAASKAAQGPAVSRTKP